MVWVLFGAEQRRRRHRPSPETMGHDYGLAHGAASFRALTGGLEAQWLVDTAGIDGNMSRHRLVSASGTPK